jgi:hypothetical protein
VVDSRCGGGRRLIAKAQLRHRDVVLGTTKPAGRGGVRPAGPSAAAAGPIALARPAAHPASSGRLFQFLIPDRDPKFTLSGSRTRAWLVTSVFRLPPRTR